MLLFLAGGAFSGAQGAVAWRETFEDEEFWDRWHVEGSAWVVGSPRSGPGRTFAGQRGAATVLNGDYPPSADARLVRDQFFVVPPAALKPRLRFWNWYSGADGDLPEVNIKVGVGAWTPIAPAFGWVTGDWCRPQYDLTPFAGLTVQIAFHFRSNNDNQVGPGWYIDEVSVESGPPDYDPVNLPEGFESGLGNWIVDHEAWEVGTPPASALPPYKGTQSIGTAQGGAYPNGADSRLISPEFIVPPAAERPRLRFYHWFSMFSDDPGQVEISVAGAPWKPLSQQYSGYNPVWTRPGIDLTPFAGQPVQIAFRFTSNTDQKVGIGWYLDEIVVETGPSGWTVGSVETFESGIGNWSAETGVWEVGSPSFTDGPMAAHGGSQCAGTHLRGNYVPDADSRLVSPEFVVPPAGDNPRLRFWQWLRSAADDGAAVEIRTAGGTWAPLAPEATGPDGSWARPLLPLGAFAGQTVQIAFRFRANADGAVGAGWYIDDAVIETGPYRSILNRPEGFEDGLGDWSVDQGSWEVGLPSAGPESAAAGRQCAGTVLAGDYRNGVDSRLISPPFVVPDKSDHPRLRYWQWFSSFGEDTGVVEVRRAGGAWEPISPPVSWNSVVWSRPSLDLSALAGQTVQIGFRFRSDGQNVATGWYVDEVVVETGFDGLDQLNEPEGFEKDLGKWAVDRGSWEVGSPIIGSTRPFRGTQCAGTVMGFWGGYYFPSTDARLISPPFTVPCLEASPRLRFAHWYDIKEGDEATLEIKVEGEPWQKVLGPITGSSQEWITGFQDLAAFAGKRIQAGFRFRSNDDRAVGYGWYIDEVRIQSSILAPIAPATVAEGSLLTVPLTATCRDYVFQLGPDAPAGVAIDPNFGLLTWIPSEDHGPGTYPINVCVAEASNPDGSLECLAILVNVTEKNDPPGIDPIAPKSIRAGVPLRFQVTAYDPDRPVPQRLTFSLDQGAPPGASIDPSSGVFTWTPNAEQAGRTHSITVRVTDDGNPPASAASAFTAAPGGDATEIRLFADRTDDAQLRITIDGGRDGVEYTLESAAVLKPVAAETVWTEISRFRWTGTQARIETVPILTDRNALFRLRRN